MQRRVINGKAKYILLTPAYKNIYLGIQADNVLVYWVFSEKSV